MNNYNYFGEFLQTLRLNNHLTQSEAAEGVCTLRQYQRLEKGESTPRIDVLFGLSEKFNVNLSDYYYYHACFLTSEIDNYVNELNTSISTHNDEVLTKLVKKFKSMPEFQYGNRYKQLCYAEALLHSWRGDYAEALKINLRGLNLKTLDSFLTMNRKQIYPKADYSLINGISFILATTEKIKEAMTGFSILIDIYEFRSKTFIFEEYKPTYTTYVYYEIAIANLAECYYLLGEYDSAYDCLQRGINYTMQHNNIWYVQSLLELKGKILAAQGKLKKARESFQQSLLLTKLKLDAEENPDLKKSYKLQYQNTEKLLAEYAPPHKKDS